VSESNKTSPGDNYIYEGNEVLNSQESSLPNYNKSIVLSFIKRIPQLNKTEKLRVLDFGAGIGTLSEIYRDLTSIEPECFEIDAKQKQIIESKGFKTVLDIDKVEGQFDLIFTSNVLEHIENDREALVSLHKTLRDSNSYLAIYVPAFSILFSDLDRTVGHFRRYSKTELLEKVKSAGFNVQYCSYSDSLGFFATFAIKIFGWKSHGNFGGPKSLLIYDRYIFPISKALDSIGVKYLVGKNLILVCKKENT
jgi:SAM-dependent methyltransferase